MSRICICCGQEIPAGRLKALPNTRTCTPCSNTGKVSGLVIINKEGEATELQIVDSETAKKLSAYDKHQAPDIFEEDSTETSESNSDEATKQPIIHQPPQQDPSIEED